jgi:hypothetical protein
VLGKKPSAPKVFGEESRKAPANAGCKCDEYFDDWLTESKEQADGWQARKTQLFII